MPKSEDMMGKKTRAILRAVVIHVLACIAASIMFHESIHEYMPIEAKAPDISFWLWPLETVFVPMRICLAAQGTLLGGRITFAQRPFLDITATYLGVVAILYTACFVLAKRNRRSVCGSRIEQVMDNTVRTSNWLIYIGFTFPIIWFLVFRYYLLSEMHNADHGVGIVIAFLYGFRGAFKIMAVFELVGTGILGWKLIKHIEYRTKNTVIMLLVGLLATFVAIFAVSYFQF